MKATLNIEDKTASFDFSTSSEMTYDELRDVLNKNEVTRVVCRARAYDLNEDGEYEDAQGKVLRFGFLFA